MGIIGQSEVHEQDAGSAPPGSVRARLDGQQARVETQRHEKSVANREQLMAQGAAALAAALRGDDLGAAPVEDVGIDLSQFNAETHRLIASGQARGTRLRRARETRATFQIRELRRLALLRGARSTRRPAPSRSRGPARRPGARTAARARAPDGSDEGDSESGPDLARPSRALLRARGRAPPFLLRSMTPWAPSPCPAPASRGGRVDE